MCTAYIIYYTAGGTVDNINRPIERDSVNCLAHGVGWRGGGGPEF